MNRKEIEAKVDDILKERKFRDRCMEAGICHKRGDKLVHIRPKEYRFSFGYLECIVCRPLTDGYEQVKLPFLLPNND
jgi:hypothetical protein